MEEISKNVKTLTDKLLNLEKLVKSHESQLGELEKNMKSKGSEIEMIKLDIQNIKTEEKKGVVKWI